jgi:hypothetical protein
VQTFSPLSLVRLFRRRHFSWGKQGSLKLLRSSPVRPDRRIDAAFKPQGKTEPWDDKTLTTN